MIFIPVVMIAFMVLIIICFVLAAIIVGLYTGFRDQLRKQRKICKKCKGKGTREEEGVLVICDSCLSR